MFLIDTDVLSALRRRERHDRIVQWMSSQRDVDIHLSVVTAQWTVRSNATNDQGAQQKHQDHPPVVRAHPCAADGQAAQALGRSRGGFSTKIHVSVDGLGNPLRFILTGGQQHDITQAEELIAGYAGEHVLRTATDGVVGPESWRYTATVC